MLGVTLYNYQSTLRQLWNLSKPGIRLDLKAIRETLSALQDPWRSFPSILIAGTNGKGSTAAMLSEILVRSGYKVGLYTSPHLSSYRERIVIREPNREMTFDEASWCRCFLRLQETITHLDASLTQFEILTALAFLMFQEAQVDVAVLEVGLGGRLDATNVVEPLLSVITPIHYDHQEYLGHTLEQIALEKAGIFRKDTPVVSAPQPQSVIKTLKAQAKKIGAPVRVVGEALIQSASLGSQIFSHSQKTFKQTLFGHHQAANGVVAIEAARSLRELGWKISEESIAAGLEMASWPGRFEVISKHPVVILDGAHNPHGAATLFEVLQSLPLSKPQVLVMGILETKDAKGIIQALGTWGDEWIVCQSRDPKAIPSDDLASLVRSVLPDKKVHPVKRVGEGCRLGLSLAGINGTVCVSGSLTTIGEARRLLKGRI